MGGNGLRIIVHFYFLCTHALPSTHATQKLYLFFKGHDGEQSLNAFEDLLQFQLFWPVQDDRQTLRGVRADGHERQQIDVPEGPANVCFGGEDFKTLFITARTSLYSVRMNVAGAKPKGSAK